jgi:peptide/nickel transport system substrate-binding protein
MAAKPARWQVVLLTLLLPALVACQTTGPAGGGAGSVGVSGPRRTKSLTLGIVGNVQAFGLGATGNTPSGGWGTASEIHSNSLITSESGSRKPIGLLAATVPSFEDGTIEILPDGRSRVIYRLRSSVTWQDGAPFTAHDLVFTQRVAADRGLPQDTQARQVATLMETTEATDDLTFTILFRQPFYQAAMLGVRPFWPLPRHLLADAYDRYLVSDNPDEMVSLAYWTTDYLHLGPFRLTEFDPGVGLTFAAYDGYYRGRPKLDVVQFRFMANPNTLFSNVLAGGVDMFLDASLNTELETQLAARWSGGNEGVIHLIGAEGGRFLMPQYRPDFQLERAVLDPRIRATFYHALDREAFAESQGRPGLAAYGIRAPGDLFYDATKDALRRYAYDPERAKALLQSLGWAPGPDGVLRNGADGRPFRTSLRGILAGQEQQVSILSDYWRRVGFQVEEDVVPAALSRDNEYLAKFGGWEFTGNRADAMLNRLAAEPSSPATRWTGNNRAGFVDPRVQQLVNGYLQSLTAADQLQAILNLSDYIATELPILPIIYDTTSVGTGKGVKAFDDLGGGGGAGVPYGLYTRNAHLWDRV